MVFVGNVRQATHAFILHDQEERRIDDDKPMRTEERMRSDLHKTRIAGDYVASYTLHDGEIKKGVHVMTPEGLAVVTGILIRPGEGVYVDVVVFGGDPNGQSFKPEQLRLATFREFCFNRTGFGRTSRIQFGAIQAVALALLAGGTWTFVEGGWSACLVAAAMEGLMVYGTWSNFKGKQA